MSVQPTHENGKHKSSSNWLQRMAASLGFSSSESLREMLERAVAEAEAEGENSLSLQERTMLLNILEFGGLRVSTVMVPRIDIVAISVEQTLSSLLRLFADAGHSRIPVYATSLDDVIGMIHIKDLMTWATEKATRQEDMETKIASGKTNVIDLGCVDLSRTIKDIIAEQEEKEKSSNTPLDETRLVRKLLFAPPLMSAVDLLAKMRSDQIHLALIVDEFGGIDGLVSIEDLVEAIVGDIDDEHDTDEELPPIIKDGSGFIATARTPIENVEETIGATLVAEAAAHGVDTLGGLILALNGSVPKRGSTVVHPSGVAFEILEGGARRITKVRITMQLALPPPDSGAKRPALLPPPSQPAEMAGDQEAGRNEVPGAKAA